MPISALGGFAQGVSEGLRNLSTIQGMKNSQSQQERADVLATQQNKEHGLRMWGLERQKEAAIKEDAAKNEISQYVIANKDKIKSMSDNLAAIGEAAEPAPFVPTAGNGWENTVGKSVFDTSKKAYEAKIKAKEVIQDQMAKITGDLTKKQYDTYLKYGLIDQAEKVQKDHFNHAKDVAATIGPQAALSMLKDGPSGELFKNSKVQDKGDHFEFKSYGGKNTNADGIMVMDKRDGSLKISQQPTPKEEEAKVVGAGAVIVKDGKVVFSNPRAEKGRDYAPSDTEKKFNFWKSLYPGLSNAEIEKKVTKEDIPSETRYVLDAVKEARKNDASPAEMVQTETDARALYKKLTGGGSEAANPAATGTPYKPDVVKADMERRGFTQRADGKWEKKPANPEAKKQEETKKEEAPKGEKPLTLSQIAERDMMKRKAEAAAAEDKKKAEAAAAFWKPVGKKFVLPESGLRTFPVYPAK